METIIDNYQEHTLHTKHDEQCSECYKEDVFVKYNCYVCEDKGYILKTNWANTDDSYDVEIKCSCRE